MIIKSICFQPPNIAGDVCIEWEEDSPPDSGTLILSGPDKQDYLDLPDYDTQTIINFVTSKLS